MSNLLSAVLGLFSEDLAIDLGTATTLVHVGERGVVISEPSVVSIDRATGQPLAFGAEAQKMLGRAPSNIEVIRPLRDGVIADFDTVELMLRHFFGKAQEQARSTRPRVVMGIPSGVTEVEKRAVHDAALNAGAREAYLIEEPLAAAIGAGLAIYDPAGSMIVDIGGGTTEVAVIALGGVVLSRSLRVGGDEIDAQIVQYARQTHDLYIGERTAEATKMAVGSAAREREDLRATMRGRDLVTGLPKAVEVSIREMREAISGPVNLITEAVKLSLEETPPELLSDIMEQGIVLAGGGALLRGMDRRLAVDTDITVHVAEDPIRCVVRGAAVCLEHMDAYRPLFTSESAPRLRL
ncbi:MAG: rod shape-determining protein [Dehalococcoidia bacterium]|nr:rod shape-determining protein [Dehalococcoidia bacterium]